MKIETYLAEGPYTLLLLPVYPPGLTSVGCRGSVWLRNHWLWVGDTQMKKEVRT